MLVTVRGRGWNTSPAQLSQDWALPQEPLWPGIPVSVSCVQPFSFPPETGLQCNLQYKTPNSSTGFRVVCACLSSKLVSRSLFPAEHLPPVDHTREETMRTREGWAGDACFTIPPLFFLFCLFLTCLILVYLFSDPLSSEYLWPSATPGFRVPKEREECENLAGLQSIVLLYNTVPFSPLSLFLFPFQVPVIQQKSKPFGYDFVCVLVLLVRFM